MRDEKDVAGIGLEVVEEESESGGKGNECGGESLSKSKISNGSLLMELTFRIVVLWLFFGGERLSKLLKRD